jgi:hypothetical protein
MKITNKKKLPKALENFALKNQKPWNEKDYSATTILAPTREILLKRRHDGEIEMDVSDMVWMILGTAVHKIMEEHDETGNSEISFREEVLDDYYLTGRADLYNEETYSLEDYKTASVWKMIYKDFEDWKKQGLIYSWLLRKQGKFVQTLKFHALLKDWNAGDKRRAEFKGDYYPENPIVTWEYNVSSADIEDIEFFIKKRITELMESERLPDEELPLCSAEERWNTGDKYAVVKENRKTAIRVFDTKEEAENFIKFEEPKATIQFRKGEDKRCKDYCPVNQFCDHYHKNVKGE